MRLELKVVKQYDGDLMDVILLYLNGLSEANCARYHLELLLGEGSYYIPGKINCDFVSGARPNPISEAGSLNIF